MVCTLVAMRSAITARTPESGMRSRMSGSPAGVVPAGCRRRSALQGLLHVGTRDAPAGSAARESLQRDAGFLSHAPGDGGRLGGVRQEIQHVLLDNAHAAPARGGHLAQVHLLLGCQLAGARRGERMCGSVGCRVRTLPQPLLERPQQRAALVSAAGVWTAAGASAAETEKRSSGLPITATVVITGTTSPFL